MPDDGRTYPVPEDIRIYIRDANYEVLHEVDDYTSLTINQVGNDVDTWEISLSGASEAAALMHYSTNPGGGIIVENDTGETLLSGPIAAFSARGSDETGEYDALTIGGTSDDVWMASRLIYPNPATTPELMDTVYYQSAPTSAEDIMHLLTTLNLGSGALAARKMTELTQTGNLHRGPVRKSPQYRFEVLLDALRVLSVNSRVSSDPATDVNFRVIQVGTGLEFQTFRSATAADEVIFSREMRSLQSYEYSVNASTATDLVLGAGLEALDGLGIRVARGLFTYQRTDPSFARRMEKFVDVGIIDPSNADTPTEIQELQDQLDQSANDVFESDGGQIGATLVPKDIDEQRFGVNYRVGDMCTVILPWVSFTERVREVEITYDSANGKKVSVSVGSEDGDYKRRTPGSYKRIADLKRYMDYLARNK